MKAAKEIKVIAIIPARGGSKSIPHKNIAVLAGKPLIVHAIEAAKQSSLLDAIVVSTDDSKIADMARACGADVPFLRPREISGDKPLFFPAHSGIYQRGLEQCLHKKDKKNHDK